MEDIIPGFSGFRFAPCFNCGSQGTTRRNSGLQPGFSKGFSVMTPSGHIFHKLFLHVNWHCHENEPMISDEIEEVLHAFIEEYCRKLKGVHFKGSGGTKTHIHLAIQVEPFVHPSELIGKLKGASSREMSKRFRHGALRWQKGYGVATFAEKNLPAILNYISNQKEHHARGTTRKALEVCQCLLDG